MDNPVDQPFEVEVGFTVRRLRADGGVKGPTRLAGDAVVSASSPAT
jgi:hypothetical protein